ncbi:Flp family type IVb pilin [Ornithinimicrobium sp. W1665]|uniref:Flp family type IVb pilin n=1 Tax=Ornithinimicrobium sp. W1665 TaxID=3416666 RepID=UPI003CEC5D50
MAAFFYTLATLKARIVESGKERGATAVEYGIMVAAIAAVIVAIVFSIGGRLQNAFQTVLTALGG